MQRLGEIFVELRQQGAHNINLVSPTQYIPQIALALAAVKPTLGIPVVYNTGGYELVESLAVLDGLVDVYLTDLKYLDSGRAEAYSGAPDYPDRACKALAEMVRQTGKPVFDSDGMLLRGTVARHLVMPGGMRDSLAVVRYLAESCDGVLLSLMRQYTPQHYNGERKELRRCVSSLEYNRVAELAAELALTGYLQEKGSAKTEYTPDFALEGVLEREK